MVSRQESDGKIENIADHSDDPSYTRKLVFKNILLRYHHQVTHGCGNETCQNKHCAQNRTISVSNDEAAAIALQLFKQRADLCVQESTLSSTNINQGDNEDMCLKREILDEVITTCQNGNDNKALISLLGNVLTKSSSLCASFSSNENMVDLEAVREMYDRLYTLNDDVVENTIVNCLETLSTDLIVQIKRKSNKFVDYRLFLIMFENPYMNQPEYMNHALPRFCQALSSIPIATAVLLIKHWSKQSKELLKTKVETLQQLITLRVIMGPSADSSSKCVNDDDAIVTAAKCLKFLFYASLYGGEHQTSSTINHIPISSQGEDYRDPFEETLKINAADCRKPLLPLDEFINEPLNDAIAVDRDFTYYKTREGFSFKECNFILTTSTKSTWMFYDNRVNMLQERRMTHFYSLLRGEPAAPYLKLTVHRDNLIQDALVNLEMIYQENPLDLKKQLFVEFAGEQGLDEGGVSKEFFQLVVEQIFNPDYGMFTYDPDTRQFWFNQTSFESHAQFMLIGLILGLAIYNNIILDVHFPMVVYRKLFARQGSLLDLKDSHPVIANSLQSMLDFDGDVESAFLCSFEISYSDVFGNHLKHELIENGKDVMVTNENREKYVERYVDYILNESIEEQFQPFKQGFDMVTKDSPLRRLFRPEELELLVCGSKDFDFEALERTTEYEGGYEATSPIVRWFWEVVHQFTLDQKKQLLMFITGSDRVPIGGLAQLKLIIARQGPNSNSLPTSHTCFNVLLLPEYSMKSQLEERLVKAITYSKGFGLI